MGRLRSTFFVTAIATSAVALSSCDRFTKPVTNANPSWAHLSGQPQMGSVIGQLLALKSKIPTNRNLFDVCLHSYRSDFRTEDFIVESKLAYATWISEAGLKAEDWKQINFVSTRPCLFDDMGYASIFLMPNVETDLGSNASYYRPATTWCVLLNSSSFQCQTDPLTLGYGGMASLKLSRHPDTERWSRIDFNTAASATLSPYIKWVSLRDSILANTSIDKKVKDGLTGRLDGLEKKDSFEKYVELAGLLEKYSLKDDQLLDDLKTRSLILRQPVLTGVRVPFIPRVAAYHVMLHEIGHQFGLDHADNPSHHSVTGNSEGTISSDRVVEKNATMAYGEPLFFLTADDKAGIRNVMKTIEQNLKDFELAQ